MSEYTRCQFLLPKDKSLKEIKRFIKTSGYNDIVVINRPDGETRLFILTVHELNLGECFPLLEKLHKKFSIRLDILHGTI
jgi:hypothetical protein